MNIHPAFVHFPIALLALYSLLEIGAHLFSCLREKQWVSPVKTFLLFTGALGALAAVFTGALASAAIEPSNPKYAIVQVHAPFALATTILYIILAAAYVNRISDRNGWVDRLIGQNGFLAWSWGVKKYVAHLILDTWALPLLALLSLACITVTGALGAAIVYGPDVDPLVTLIYNLFLAH